MPRQQLSKQDHVISPYPQSSHNLSRATFQGIPEEAYFRSPYCSDIEFQSSALPSSPPQSQSPSSDTTEPSTSKKKHICATCHKAFTTSGHLSRHARVHTGERNHKCPFPGCETRCSRQDNLQQHYRIHLSPGSRRSSGSASRSALARALGDETGGAKKRSKYSVVLPIPRIPPVPDSPPTTPPALEMAYPSPAVFSTVDVAHSGIPLHSQPELPTPDSPPALTSAHSPTHLPAAPDITSERSSPSSENGSASYHSESPLMATESPLSEHRPPMHSPYSGSMTFQQPQGGEYPYYSSTALELGSSSALASGMPSAAVSFSPYGAYEAPALQGAPISPSNSQSQHMGALRHDAVLLQPAAESFATRSSIYASLSYGHSSGPSQSESPPPDDAHSYSSSYNSGHSTPAYGVSNSIGAHESRGTSSLVHTHDLVYAHPSEHSHVYHQHIGSFPHIVSSHMHYGAVAHPEVH